LPAGGVFGADIEIFMPSKLGVCVFDNVFTTTAVVIEVYPSPAHASLLVAITNAVLDRLPCTLVISHVFHHLF
jgi:hypothetical protein